MSDRAIRFILSFLGAGLLSLCLISAAIRVVFIDAAPIGPVANNLFGLLILALGVYVGVRYALWVDRSWRPVDPTKCRSCGYSLRGLKSNRCPECGTLFERAFDAELQEGNSKPTDGESVDGGSAPNK